jgi:polyphenol oxidase
LHGVFTRRGGVSAPPFDSLNVSDAVGDRPEAVAQNLQIIKDVFGTKDLVQMNQVHGRDIRVIRRDDGHIPDTPPRVDALITDVPGLALMVKQADCQGVIIHDPIRNVISVVHCGWRGNVENILGHVVVRMQAAFGCNPSELLAAIGPSLGPCCAEFSSHQDIFPQEFTAYADRSKHFNLWSISCRQLTDSGLLAGNIEVAWICTRCGKDTFYSYRREKTTGRFGTIVMLR